jgi:heme exporter protein C
MMGKSKSVWVLAALAAVLLAVGHYLGLAWAPPDREMGDVQRIMYVHVPLQWMAMLLLTLNFACALAYLFKPSWRTDSLAEASAEVGLVCATLGLVTGAIWGKPTWGVYWSWDPRLTAEAIMIVTYTGYLALRRFVEDPERRAVWSAVVGIIGFVNLPIVWFSVRWWRSLHQVQSSPRTVDPELYIPLRVNAFGFLALVTVFVAVRYWIALREREQEVALPEALPPRAARSQEVA